MSSSQIDDFKQTLESDAGDYGVELSRENIELLREYYSLLQTWNQRLHLVAPCSPNEFARRHILESLMLLHHLPANASIVDIGSGAGLPIIPCLVVRPDISSTLIEASKKKAVFLREALRGIDRSESATVIAERFEAVTTPNAGFVSCRALERFTNQIPALIKWSPRESTLMFFGGESLREKLDKERLGVAEIKIPNSRKRFLFIGTRQLS